jgi:hypothetical protein
MSDRKAVQTNGGAQTIGYKMSDPCGETICTPQSCTPQSCTPQSCTPQSCSVGCQTCDPCQSGACHGGNGHGGNGHGSCYTPMNSNACFNGCDASGGSGGWGSQCQTCDGYGNGGHGRLHGRHGRNSYGNCDECSYGHSGFAGKCKTANCKLCDCLFGWMIPSGCGGQGCPPVGKYHMTYADQPSYIDQRDTQLYAAQGYGMPMSVPLAPNVHHAYNYSSGIPASRITHIGNYNPRTSPQQLPCQSW